MAVMVLVEDPEDDEVGEAIVDSAQHTRPLYLDGVEEEQQGVHKVITAPAHVQLLLLELHHVVSRALVHLDHGEAVLVRLPSQLVPELDKVSPGERGCVLAQLPGGGEQPGVEVGGQTVHHQLAV